jgi:hypothetical protein
LRTLKNPISALKTTISVSKGGTAGMEVDRRKERFRAGAAHRYGGVNMVAMADASGALKGVQPCS